MKRVFGLILLNCIFTSFIFGENFKINLIPVCKAWARNSVNAAIFRNSSVITHGKYQYISFYDKEGNVILGKRKTNSEKWELQKTQFKGDIKDAHRVISIMADGEGYLHISWDHHGNALHYAKSIAPESLTLGDMEKMTGKNESHVTYPEFYQLPSGDLLFAYRDGGSGNGNLILNRYSTSTKSWTRIQDVLIDGEGKRNAYWQLCIDNKGGIHISWVWRETPDVSTNHDLCYAYSPDEGRTWLNSEGSAFKLPITAENAEYICRIPQKSELINQTSMTCDEECHPYIVSYWSSQDSKVPQFRLVYFDGTKWNEQQITQRTTPFSLCGGGTKKNPVSRPKVAVETYKGKTHVYCIYRDEERGSKVSLAYNEDVEKGRWLQTDLTDFSVGSWEPGYDIAKWNKKKQLSIFVQNSGQGDGEKLEDIPDQMIYIMEVGICH